MAEGEEGDKTKNDEGDNACVGMRGENAYRRIFGAYGMVRRTTSNGERTTLPPRRPPLFCFLFFSVFLNCR